jgi:hypothetical protein
MVSISRRRWSSRSKPIRSPHSRLISEFPISPHIYGRETPRRTWRSTSRYVTRAYYDSARPRAEPAGGHGVSHTENDRRRATFRRLRAASPLAGEQLYGSNFTDPELLADNRWKKNELLMKEDHHARLWGPESSRLRSSVTASLRGVGGAIEPRSPKSARNEFVDSPQLTAGCPSTSCNRSSRKA